MILTRKEFENKYGLKKGYVQTYSKRGNLVIEEDGKIDLNNPVNNYFIMNREGKATSELPEFPYEPIEDDAPYKYESVIRDFMKSNPEIKVIPIEYIDTYLKTSLREAFFIGYKREASHLTNKKEIEKIRDLYVREFEKSLEQIKVDADKLIHGIKEGIFE